jgi:asparagine synthase (glutamine-hydrolysing)
MCGIAGAFSYNNPDFLITEDYIKSMRDTMIPRGPDGEGVWISKDNKVGLGFRRLAIIDLSTTANQPMCNEDGSLWLIFNGEIYNHAEIRAELIRIGGHVWKTDHSDTEMILHAYEQWGVDCINRFRGMFAIALWDTKKEELLLVRDRIGVKPVYYSVHNGRIVFASEIKALLMDPQQKRVINEEGFFHYLSFLTVPAPDTLFEDIHKIPPGCWMKINRTGEITHHKYWDVLDHVYSMEGISEEDISKLILEQLRVAVDLRKVGDVPVGVFLSGGIDSSTNAALFSENEADRGVKTFSIGYDGDYDSYKNELEYAKLVADAVGAQYHEKLLNINDLIDFLPEMIKLQDEPIADPVCVPVYYVSKLARENGVIVCQVGEGADELFWGYPNWKSLLYLQQLSNKPYPFFARKMLVKLLKGLGLNNDWRFEYIRRSSENIPVFWGGAESFTNEQKMRLLSRRMRNKFKGRTSWDVLRPIHDRFLQKAKNKDPLSWMTYLDLNMRLPELLLMRVDKMTMANSIEGRVPFLDHKFVEMAMSIPWKTKTKNGVLKYILKKAVRSIIPDMIIDRKKQGFAAPIEEWFSGMLGEVARKDIKEFCDATDLIEYATVENILSGPQKSTAWPILNVAMWWKNYIKN